MTQDPEQCSWCWNDMVLDHTGPDGSQYWRCPKCDDPFQTVPGKMSAEVGNFLDDVVEQQSDLGIDMRDAAFLWDLGIRVDQDMLAMFRTQRTLAEIQK